MQWTGFFAMALMTACGGGGGGSSDSAAPSVRTTARAVDPYISGARFVVVGPDGSRDLYSEDVSSSEGIFHFQGAIAPGSEIVMLAGSTGMHGGAPFEGILRRKVGAVHEDVITVSPLTTLLAAGASAEEVVKALADAGIGGLTIDDLLDDPMGRLDINATVANDAGLRLLQANMAVHAMLFATGGYETSGIAPAATASPIDGRVLANTASAVKEALGSEIFRQIAAELSLDADVRETPVVLADLIAAAVDLNRTVVAEYRQQIESGAGTGFNAGTAVRDRLGELRARVKDHVRSRKDEAVPPPGTGADAAAGKIVYDSQCAGCHKLDTYDPSGSPDLAGKSAGIAAKLSAGHMGISLSTAQRDALVTFIAGNSPAPAPAPAPSPSPAPANCTSCHGQPPAGTAFPNTAGAHAAHAALPGVGTNCAVCHTGYVHQNGAIELGFTSAYNARTGAVVDNGDGTCSNVSCHGGKKTPDWWSGKIDVNTQCTSCHAAGTAQYNGYSSGRHSKHAGYACTECHDTTKLAGSHFSNLNTSAMEGPTSGTLKSFYNGSSCSVSCHGESHQGERWR